MSARQTGTPTRTRIKLRPRFFVIITLFFIVCYLVYGYTSGFLRMRALRIEIEQVQREIEELRMLNAELEQQLSHYDSDEVIERIAREQLRLVAPGEAPVIIVDPPSTSGRLGKACPRYRKSPSDALIRFV